MDQLVDSGRVKSLADLYSLRPLELVGLDRMGQKSADNLVEAIDKARAPALGRLLFALGIRHVGETTARDVARHFGSIEAIMDADEDALSSVPDVGPVVAGSIRRFFAEQHNRDVIEQLKAQGVHPVAEAVPEDTTLAGKTFVLTGTLDARGSLDAHPGGGGKVSGSVSRRPPIWWRAKRPAASWPRRRNWASPCWTRMR